MSHYNTPIVLRKCIEYIVWPLQGLIVLVLVTIIRLLPVRLTSALFGHILSVLGPKLPHHKRALRHLRYAMPELSDDEQNAILAKMWSHFGRLVGEYPHIHKMGTDTFLTFHGLEHLQNATKGGFVIGGHLGNWELSTMVAAMMGRHYGVIYRPLNNPYANWALDMRRKRGKVDLYAKGQDAARGMLKTLKQNGLVFLYTDQKYREGMMAPFLGHDAPTPIGHIKIALKQKLPVFYMRVIRTSGCHYDVYIEPPIYLYEDGKADEATIAAHAAHMNDKLSQFIRENPEQWLWPHRRWGKNL